MNNIKKGGVVDFKNKTLDIERYKRRGEVLIQIRPRQDILEKIDALAKEHKIKRTGVIMAILDAYFKEEE